jgi:hypothetical protein
MSCHVKASCDGMMAYDGMMGWFATCDDTVDQELHAGRCHHDGRYLYRYCMLPVPTYLDHGLCVQVYRAVRELRAATLRTDSESNVRTRQPIAW